MTVIGELDLPVLHYADLELTGAAFHERMHGLRDRHWVARVDPLGYVVLDHEGVEHILRTRSARMPAIEILELQGVTDGPMHAQLAGNLINLHGEDHRRLRGLVNPAFTPAAVAALRPSMRAHATELLEGVATDEVVDFVAAVAKPYPARMIAEIVGAPLADADRLGDWAYWIQSTFDPAKVAGNLPQIEQAAAEFDDYVRGLLREGGTEGLLATLRGAMAAGGLSEDECVHLVGSVLIGGVDTTRAQLSHTVRLLAEHPAQWERLRTDPALAMAATEEALRYEPIAPFTARLVTEDLTHRGILFPAGTVVFACALTANHDPALFAEPARFDISADRKSAKTLTFGAGPHFCLGAALARAELAEALELIARRWTTLELAGEPVYDTPPGVYGLLSLPIRVA